jgi:hypothetical protein
LQVGKSARANSEEEGKSACGRVDLPLLLKAKFGLTARSVPELFRLNFAHTKFNPTASVGYAHRNFPYFYRQIAFAFFFLYILI